MTGMTVQHTAPLGSTTIGALGAHHIAYPCWDPAATLRLYRDTLGFTVPHAIPAKGWGPDNNPDMVHFFFDVGNRNLLAFFYYFGWERPQPHPRALQQATHIALRVPDEATLLAIHRRLVEAGYSPQKNPVRHETIESIYLWDPNDLLLEFTWDMRPMDQRDAADAQRTMDALVKTVAADGQSIEDVWRTKAGAQQSTGRAAIHVVDAPEFQPLIAWAKEAGLTVTAQGDYQVISSVEPIEFTRKETGLRASLWFSMAAGGLEGRITQFDWYVFRLEP